MFECFYLVYASSVKPCEHIHPGEPVAHVGSIIKVVESIIV